jgi:hypothetical protein
MAAKISGGRDEIGDNALRRRLSARIDSCNDLILVSMARCRRFWFILDRYRKRQAVIALSRAAVLVMSNAYLSVVVELASSKFAFGPALAQAQKPDTASPFAFGSESFVRVGLRLQALFGPQASCLISEYYERCRNPGCDMPGFSASHCWMKFYCASSCTKFVKTLADSLLASRGSPILGRLTCGRSALMNQN